MFGFTMNLSELGIMGCDTTILLKAVFLASTKIIVSHDFVKLAVILILMSYPNSDLAQLWYCKQIC
jgi:hypothetical protein